MMHGGQSTKQHSIHIEDELHSDNSMSEKNTERKSVFHRIGNQRQSVFHRLGNQRQSVLKTDHILENHSLNNFTKETTRVNDSNVKMDNSRKRRNTSSPKADTRCKASKTSRSPDATNDCRNVKSNADKSKKDCKCDGSDTNTTRRLNQSSKEHHHTRPTERNKSDCESLRSRSGNAKVVNRSSDRRMSRCIEKVRKYVRSDRTLSRSGDRIAICDDFERKHPDRKTCSHSGRRRSHSTERKTYSHDHVRRPSYSSDRHRQNVQYDGNDSENRKERQHSKRNRASPRSRNCSHQSEMVGNNNIRGNESQFDRNRSNYTERYTRRDWTGLDRPLDPDEHQRHGDFSRDTSYSTDLGQRDIAIQSRHPLIRNGTGDNISDGFWQTNPKELNTTPARNTNKYYDNDRQQATFTNVRGPTNNSTNFRLMSEKGRQTDNNVLCRESERHLTSVKSSNINTHESSNTNNVRLNYNLRESQRGEQTCESNKFRTQNKTHRCSYKKQNGLTDSNRKIDLDNISRMDADDIAVHLSTSNYQEFDTFLWRRTHIDNISLLIDVLGSLCESSRKHLVRKAIYPLKERKFFDRSDVREFIYELRNTDSELSEKQTKSLTNLLIIIKGLSDNVNGAKTDLLQSLDSLEMTCGLKIKDQSKKTVIDGIIGSIRDNWSSKKSTRFDNKISILTVLPDIDEIEVGGYDIDINYEDEAGYLNRLFMVHRQDFIRPLCRGLVSLKNNLYEDSTCLDRRWQHDDIRVYTNIQFISKSCNHQSGIAWKIEFDPTPYRKINWATRKLLMHGSLLCFTNKEFDFIYYATVTKRDPEDLKTGFVEIKLHESDEINRLLNQQEIILIESQAFFPSYYHSLESLKSIHYKVSCENEVLPFRQQIVHLNTIADQPDYFELPIFKELGFDLRCFIPYHGSVNISDESNWPLAEELGVDGSQYEALITAMTNKLALIQGPPGTGKTVVGLKIAELLLHNETIWRCGQNNGPMLLLSYTNHALDQFLSDILKKVPDLNEQNVVRLGSRSENADLKNYNLTVHRQRHDSFGSINDNEQPFAVAKRNLTIRMTEHAKLNYMKDELNTGLVNHTWLYYHGFMSRSHYKHIDKWGDFVQWLYLPALLNAGKISLQHQEDMEYFEDDFDFADMNEADWSDDEICDIDINLQSENFRRFDFDYVWMVVSSEDVRHENRLIGNSFMASLTYEENVHFMRKLREKIRSTIPFTHEQALSIIDVWQMHLDERWRLYKYWIQRVLNVIDNKTRECEESYERAKDRFTEVQRTTDVKILKRSKLIACTTTRAARDIDILRRVSPKIILMEEAAEIPEHHVVSCLTPSCDQLIMIGDHQQLRPAYNDFHTAKKHQINISLFERLIRAGFPRKNLKYQHRMRPTISRLLVPHIYKVLEDDKSVQMYENVKGVHCNLYFVSHTVHEDNEREEASRSHKNTHEASFICGLYKYLRLQGYRSSQITILSPYVDQVRLLRTMAKPIDGEFVARCPTENAENNIIQGVRITAIDNFQGEENDIILISLVRSNLRQNIGYLKEANRICVALSRAKLGLYLIGNFELLSSRSELWEKIVTDAKNGGFVGATIPLTCQNHKVLTNIRDANGFEMVKDGGCNKECKFKRDCGHYCSRKCHVDDSFHNEKCLKSCSKSVCERGHKCGKICHPFRCDLCMELVDKTIPKCGHLTRMLCYKDPSLGQCKERCQMMIACGHRCQRTCTQVCNTQNDCNELIKTTARCGHEVQVACHTKYDPPCKINCKEVLQCGHTCTGNCSDCSQGRLHVPCKKKCDRNLVCGHICRKYCYNNCLPCTQKCDRRCSHGDKCKWQCGKRCTPCQEPCMWRCRKTCPNGYKCSKACLQSCDRPKCNARCNKKLKCGHVCPGLLCEKKCIEVCKECNKDKMSEICCFGTEDEDDPILIQLEDCDCIIEVDTLDNFVSSKLDVESDNEINSLKCPKCQRKITKSSRYRHEIRMINSDIEQIFRAASNADEMINFSQKREEVRSIMNKCTWNYDSKMVDKYNRMVGKPKSVLELNLIADIFTFLAEIAELKTTMSSIGDDPFLLAWCKRLEFWVFMKRERFSEQEHKEFNTEILRVSLAVEIDRFKKELLDQNKDEKAFVEEINEHLKELKSKTKISDQDLSLIRTKITDASSKLLGLSIEEKVMIKRAMETELMGSGHWYKCSNGHYYSIGECGMPMEERTCPNCNVTIGGRSHMLSEQNEQAMDMETI